MTAPVRRPELVPEQFEVAVQAAYHQREYGCRCVTCVFLEAMGQQQGIEPMEDDDE